MLKFVARHFGLFVAIASVVFVIVSIKMYDAGTIGLTQLMINGAIAFVADAYFMR